MFKKVLFLLLFSLFFVSTSPTEAVCDPRVIPQNCPANRINACNYGGNFYCCDVPNECVPKCSNGMSEGQTTCDGATRVMICRPGQSPEMQIQETCTFPRSCVEGAGCSGNPSPVPSQTPIPTFPPLTPIPTVGGSETSPGDLATDSFLNSVNPLAVGVNQGPPNFLNFLAGVFNIVRFRTPGQFLSALFPWLFTFAGLILFVMLLWGGFEMLSGAATPNSQEAGKNRIQAAVIGFFLLFITYWIAQIIQTIFGVNILGQ